MSVYAYMYVWECANQKSTSLLMMLALADYANQETGECFPGIPALAKKLRTSERNVQLLLRGLEEDREITILPNKGQATGTGNTNRYRLNGYVEWYQAVKKISPLNDDITDEGVKDSALRGETLRQQGVKKLSPKPLLNPSTNRNNGAAPSKEKTKRLTKRQKLLRELEPLKELAAAALELIDTGYTAGMDDPAHYMTVAHLEKYLPGLEDLQTRNATPEKLKALYAKLKPIYDAKGWIIGFNTLVEKFSAFEKGTLNSSPNGHAPSHKPLDVMESEALTPEEKEAIKQERRATA